jgi:myo-inositol-1(or 4)-monophosphatase
MRDAELLRELTSRPFKVRKMGAVALELAYVAAGWYDALVASFGKEICLWDVAAGLLLVEEAGGQTSDLQGRPYEHGGPDLVAGSAAVQAQLVELIAGKLAAD